MTLSERIVERLGKIIKSADEYKKKDIRTAVGDLKNAINKKNAKDVVIYANKLGVGTKFFNRDTLNQNDIEILNAKIEEFEAKVIAQRAYIVGKLEAEIRGCTDTTKLKSFLEDKAVFDFNSTDWELLDEKTSKSFKDMAQKKMAELLKEAINKQSGQAELLKLLQEKNCWISDNLTVVQSGVKKDLLNSAALKYADLQIETALSVSLTDTPEQFFDKLSENCRKQLSLDDKQRIEQNYQSQKNTLLISLEEAQKKVENKFKEVLKEATADELTTIADSADSVGLKTGVQAVFTRKASTDESTDILSNEIDHPINKRIKAFAQLQKDVLDCSTRFDVVCINKDRAPLTSNDEKPFVEKMFNSGIKQLPENERTQIAKAGDLNAFKEAVKRLRGISESKAAMLDSTSKEEIQGYICKQYFNEKYKANPALISLLTDLDLARQQQIIGEPEKIKSLQAATTAAQVTAVLGEGIKVETAELFAENNAKTVIGKIYNNQIVEKLSEIPGLMLTAQDIERINSFIVLTAANENYFVEDDAYLSLVKIISGNDNVHQALGCSGTPLRVTNTAIKDAVSNQHLYNTSIRTKGDGNALTRFLLPLKKTARVTDDEFDKCYKHLVESNSKKAFIDGLSAFGDGTLTQAIKDTLSDETYSALKHEGKKQTYINPANEDYKTLIRIEKEKLRGSKDKLEKLVNASYYMENTLKELGEIKPAYWLDPAFRESARQKASELESLVKESAARYKNLLEALTAQKKEIELVRSTLPDELTGNDTKTKILATFKKELNEHEASIDKQIAIYEPIHKKFSGDPSASNEMERKGYVGMIASALTENKDVQLAAPNISYEDIEKERKEEYLKKIDNTPIPKRSTTLQVGGKLFSYKATEEKLADNKVRIARISTKSRMDEDVVVSYAIEQEKTSNGYKTTYTLGDVPKVTPPPSPKNPNPKPQVDYKVTAEAITSSVADALMNLKEPPSQQNQFIISGDDPVELELYWTALMIAGEMHPTMKFNEGAIKVNGPFDPTSVMKRNVLGKASYGENSLYQQVFNQLPQLKTVIRDSFQFGEDQKQGQHEYKRLFKNLKRVDGNAKEAAEEVIQQSKMAP